MKHIKLNQITLNFIKDAKQNRARYKERFGVLLETGGLRANSDCNYRLSQQPLVKSHYSHCMIPLLLVTNTAPPQHLKTNHVQLPFLPFLSISLLYSSNSLSIPFHVSSYPFIPSFTVIYPLSVSASVSETPIYSNSIPYRTAHSLWNKVFFSTAVLWTADAPALFLFSLQHSLPSAPHCPRANLSSRWFWSCWSVPHGFCMFFSKSYCEREVVCVLHTEQMSLRLPYKWMRPCKTNVMFLSVN